MTWYIDQGPESDVMITSRIRLARNLDHYPFPHRMDKDQSRQAGEEITKAFFGHNKERKNHYLLVELDDLNEADQLALAEKRLISRDMAKDGSNRRVIISRDEAVSIMINEEDHIRIQSMQPGLNLEAAYEAAAAVTLALEGSLSLAYSEKYGFLTACPTNTGTGMRASVMAHLPGLVMSGRIKDVIESLNKMGFAVRGNYGEHSKAQGHMFQISNQLTLGLTEDDLISDLQRMLVQLIDQERKVRREVYRQQPIKIEDRIMRSFGLLTYARLLSHEEVTGLLSDIRLGLALGLLPGVKETDINKAWSSIGPASIQKSKGQPMTAEERDHARASLMNEIFQKS